MTPEEEFCTYDTFKSLIPLLNSSESTSVQLWAIWSIHHFCSKNRENIPIVFGKLILSFEFLLSQEILRYVSQRRFIASNPVIN